MSTTPLQNWFAQDEWSQVDALPGTDPFGVGSRSGRQLLATRVVGVGVGVFLLWFFFALSILICLVGSRTKIRWVIYFASAAMFGIVALVLIVSPKGTKPPKPAEGYDQTIIALVIIAALLGVGVILGAVGLLLFAVLPTVYNRPLNYHLDILEQHEA